MVRCFIGILLPEEIKESIIKVVEKIRNLPLECKFVEKDNLHICLSFLSEISESEIEKISKDLETISLGFKPFDVFIKGIKLIPNESFLRVIALDVLDQTGRIESLRKGIVKIIGGDSKPPHITLCRIKNVKKKELTLQNLKKLGSLEIGRFKIEKIQLIKSELRREGPIYSVIHESKFSQ
ncbi:MAG: RNA 2',3'-cyclic phosphodiesterase [Candidatus Aenigmatarchaeota archaeon]